jgi:hypothetical protein
LDDAEFTFILSRENCTQISAFRSSGARTKADVTKRGHELESFCYALHYRPKKWYMNNGVYRNIRSVTLYYRLFGD